MKLLEIDTSISNEVIELRKTYKIRLSDAITATSIKHNGLLVTNDIRLKN